MNKLSAVQIKNPISMYFGKISSRGDFVKSTSGTKVIALIDNWIAQGMEMLIAQPDWKANYDAAGAVDFLFVGIRKKHAICGSLVPSGDLSSRRFPFIAATLFEIDDTLNFFPFSPVLLERHLNHQRALIHYAAKARDATETLSALNDVSLETSIDKETLVTGYTDFLTHTTLADLANALSTNKEQATVRQMILGIGYLLQPILTNYMVPPQRGLSIPVPKDPSKLANIKAFWLDLISTFLPRAEFEISIYSCTLHGHPKLVVTFNGVTPETFQSLFEESAAEENLIDIAQATWVEEYAMQDDATLKLSSYMEHEQLSLLRLVETFRQGFAG